MAGLPKQLINVPFAGGLDQKTDPWLISAGKQTNIVNGVFTKQGQIRKRYGMQDLPRTVLNGTSVSTGKRIFFHQNEQLSTDGNNLYAYSPDLNTNINVDQVPQATVQRTSLFTNSQGFSDPDVATSAGFEIYVWKNAGRLQGGDIFSSLLDEDGNVLLDAIALTVTSAFCVLPKVFVVGTTAIATYKNETNNTLRARALDLTNVAAGWGIESTLINDFSGIPTDEIPYDGNVIGNRLVIVYPSIAGTVRLRSFTSSLTLDVTNDAAAQAPTFVGIMGTAGESLFVGYSAVVGPNSNTYSVVCDPVTLVPSSSVILFSTTDANGIGFDIGICRIDATTALYMIQTGIDQYVDPGLIMQKANNAGALVGPARQMSGITSISRPFVSSGRAYAYVLMPAAPPVTSGTTFLVDLQHAETQSAIIPSGFGTFRAVATVAPRFSSPSRSFNSLSSVAVALEGGFLSCGSIVLSAETSPLTGLTRMHTGLSDTNRFQPGELGPNLHLSGGTPLAYDGRIAQEIGFFTPPDVTQLLPPGASGVTKSAVGGGLTGLGLAPTDPAYLYQFTFEYRDARGQMHRSAPSSVVRVQFAAGTTNSVTFRKILHLGLTNRQDDGDNYSPPVALVVYRSAWNGTTMSSVLYRLTTERILTYQFNNPTGAPTSFSFVDNGLTGTIGGVPYNFTDVGIVSHPYLYTTGGVLPNVCPPSSSIAHVHKNRLWLAGTDEPNDVWYSKQFVSGEAVSFCDEFKLSLSDAGGITALATLDDKLIIFKASAIYVVVGDGPPDNGVGNDLSDPQRVASDVGCIEPRSVVATPQGIMFQSSEGIMLLSRKLEVSYTGHPVEDSLTAYPVITSAVLVSAQSQIRFTCQAFVDSPSGITLVYDYVQDAWTIFDIYDASIASNLASQASAAISPDGVYVSLATSGTSYQEKQAGNATRYLDSTAQWVGIVIESAWIKTSGVLGFQRVRRVGVLGNPISNTDLTLSMAPDYNTSYLQSHTWRAGDPSFGPPERMTVHVGSANGMHQKCESMRTRISDAIPSSGPVGTGEGVTFSGLSMEIATKPDMVRLPAAARE